MSTIKYICILYTDKSNPNYTVSGVDMENQCLVLIWPSSTGVGVINSL